MTRVCSLLILIDLVNNENLLPKRLLGVNFVYASGVEDRYLISCALLVLFVYNSDCKRGEECCQTGFDPNTNKCTVCRGLIKPRERWDLVHCSLHPRFSSNSSNRKESKFKALLNYYHSQYSSVKREKLWSFPFPWSLYRLLMTRRDINEGQRSL